jgi:hypothetical protein
MSRTKRPQEPSQEPDALDRGWYEEQVREARLALKEACDRASQSSFSPSSMLDKDPLASQMSQLLSSVDDLIGAAFSLRSRIATLYRDWHREPDGDGM